jgi:tetratricopeptide (TPR) repeat protein|tara:strand:- start:740 stop:1984 length:1245 start_codon:yes stop_codon:yes gene_type:complete
MILMMQATLERLYGAFLVYGVLVAVIVYIIRRQIKNPDNDPVKVIVKWVVTLAVVAFMIHATVRANDRGSLLVVFILLLLPGSILLGLWWTPAISEWIASPITNALTGDSREFYNKPEYGIANARRKRGQYVEAIEAVDEQLVKHPGNFDGLMLKSAIQAENLGDLAAAAATIQEAVSDPEQLNYRLPVALNKMADWQLTVAVDPDAARRTLRQIRTAMPNSQAAQLAAQRLASLDSSEESESDIVDFNESYQKLVEESAAKDDFTSPLELPKAIELNRQQADEKALQTCLRRVEMHPDSVSNREELAALYLGHAKQPALALEQYERLLALPGTTIHQKTAWLNKLADIQIKSSDSYEAVRATLERVIALDPKAAPAARAQQRISYLNIELRGVNRKTTKLQLGSYDEDLGLKS